jgi:hypothetical protein
MRFYGGLIGFNGGLMGFNGCFMGFIGGLIGFNGGLMGFNAGLMGFNGGLMGFHGDLMKCPCLMASAQKNNKNHGIETQTCQKDMKSIAKHQTTQDLQTSKGQRRHVQLDV